MPMQMGSMPRPTAGGWMSRPGYRKRSWLCGCNSLHWDMFLSRIRLMPMKMPKHVLWCWPWGQHLQISVFPDGKGQWTEGKLSAARKLDVKQPWCHGLPGRILSASPFLACLWRCHVVRYLWWGSAEMRLCKINLKEGTTRFSLVQALSKSNGTMSSITVLCYGRIGCPRWVAGCYLYGLENFLIDMASFQFCYNLNKHVPDCDSWLGLHPTSWATTAIGPLTRVTFVISSVLIFLGSSLL
jgi:hypothetical protein